MRRRKKFSYFAKPAFWHYHHIIAAVFFCLVPIIGAIPQGENPDLATAWLLMISVGYLLMWERTQRVESTWEDRYEDTRMLDYLRMQVADRVLLFT